MSNLESSLRRALLGITLILSCVAGFLTSYVILMLVVAATLLLVSRGEFVVAAPARVFVGCFLGIAVLFAINARQPLDLIYILNFFSLLFFAPLATLYAQAASPQNSRKVADMALVGTAIGCAYALLDGLALGHDRAGSYITDPIRLADTALILGFLAMTGVLSREGSWRWIYLSGPLLALLTIFLTGSRGALLAYLPIMVTAAFLLVRHKVVALAIGVGCGILLAALVSFTDVLGARSASLLQVASDLARGVAADEQTRIRLELYGAAWEAFKLSPIFGHGWAGMMPSLLPFLAEADRPHALLPHVHNELLNFAVFGGVFGIAIYLVLLALPIVACLQTPRDSQFGARLYGCSLLSLSYFMLGLPDTMLSFELHTAMYIALCAVLLAYCRDDGISAAATRAAIKRKPWYARMDSNHRPSD